MKNIKIVVIDDSEAVCKTLRNELSAVPGFDVIKTITDPLLAESEIRSLKPDILLLDAIMSPIDGDDILENLQRTPEHNLGIIVLSPINNDLAIRHYSKLGAHYFIEKPVNTTKLIKKISLLKENLSTEETVHSVKYTAENEKKKTLASRITRVLLKSGVSPKLKGFCFIREGVNFICLSGNELTSVTKIVYPKIATEYATEPEKVERAIRTAIEKAFSCDEGRRFYYETLCSGNFRKSAKPNPSNREFIFTIVEYIKNIEQAELIG